MSKGSYSKQYGQQQLQHNNSNNNNNKQTRHSCMGWSVVPAGGVAAAATAVHLRVSYVTRRKLPVVVVVVVVAVVVARVQRLMNTSHSDRQTDNAPKGV